ncbi:MAG TPA: hypothetical protein VL003_12575 [Pusillimonas sp.]|nr:hypothetical protein [Pusillimonas sp.]HUH88865.1 hypothetical protein [Pusillimonas sp.]
MGLFKPSDNEKKDSDSSMSLLRGLFILAIIGIIAYLIVNYYAG